MFPLPLIFIHAQVTLGTSTIVRIVQNSDRAVRLPVLVETFSERVQGLGSGWETKALTAVPTFETPSTLLCSAESLSHAQLSAAPLTLARQAPLSMGIHQARRLEWVARSAFLLSTNLTIRRRKNKRIGVMGKKGENEQG